MNLIWDRTQADVDRWKALRDKGWQAMTDEERAEWLTSMKGAYNHTDMNRVEQAVEYLSERMRSVGCIFHPEVKTTWTVQDKPQKVDFERYCQNVKTLRDLLTVYSTTPQAPTTTKKLDYQMANDLEKILVDVNDLINKMEKTWFYSNDVFCGEV